jgi:PadR family transcriptional regulator AphA
MRSEWPSENIILAWLAEQPMHGYELAQRVREDEAMRAIWRIERSEVYFLLAKLLRHGYVVESAAEQGGGPPRTVYALTQSGQMALEQWLVTPDRTPRNLRTALLARVYIALRRDPRLALSLIDAQKQALVDWLAQARERQAHNEVVMVVHRFRAAQVRAVLEALRELRALAESRLGSEAASGAGVEASERREYP